MTTATTKQPKRGRDILRIISDHGPLSIELLHRMITPQMSKKNLRKSLQVLRKKNLIESALSSAQSTFYMTAQGLKSRTQSSDRLDRKPEDLQQPLLRRQDWFHNQWCEYWILTMKRQFPKAEFIRERSIGSHQIAMNVLKITKQDFDLRPDFLLRLPNQDTAESTYLAFEIERTRKSNDRLIRKFRKYMDGTHIDGLIYICDTGRLSETIRLLYANRLVAHSQRQKRFGENFFLFSDSLDGGGPQLPRLFNASGKLTSFENWCGYLESTKWTKRRDEDLR